MGKRKTEDEILKLKILIEESKKLKMENRFLKSQLYFINKYSNSVLTHLHK